MTDFLVSLFEQYRMLILILAGSSIFLFLATPLIIPLVIRSMHQDYFIRVSEKGVARSSARRFLYFFWHVMKNIIGVLFFISGIILLFAPGQGILTIIAGLVLLDFPGKHRFINRLTGGQRIRSALNWIRRKTGKPHFLFRGMENNGLLEEEPRNDG